jgi:hypothetical protein
MILFWDFPQEIQDKVLLLTNLYVIQKKLSILDWDDIFESRSG